DSLPTPTVRVDHGCCDADILLASPQTSPQTSSRNRPDSRVGKDHSNQFRTLDYRSDRIFDHGRLETFLNDLPEPVVRAKGWVHDNQGVWWLQSVGKRWTLEPAAAIPAGTSLVFVALANNTIAATLAGIKRSLQSL
ncbi:MAG: GTP-binding protein, partial [Gammaproteobacteria bacterium]|nr:GTP-binding protein [Gammaproteobacteria bacterium]